MCDKLNKEIISSDTKVRMKSQVDQIRNITLSIFNLRGLCLYQFIGTLKF